MTREHEIREVLARATGTGWEAAYRQDVGYLLARCDDFDQPGEAFSILKLRARVAELEATIAAMAPKPAPVPTVDGGRRNCWTCGREDGNGDCVPYHNDAAVRRWSRRVATDLVSSMPPHDADNCPGWSAKVTP